MDNIDNRFKLDFGLLTLILARKRVDTVDISWEQRSFFNVSNTTVFSGESFKSHADTTMRGDTVFEGLKIEFKLVWIKSFAFNA